MQLSSAHSTAAIIIICFRCCVSSLPKELPDHMLADQHKRKPGGHWARASCTLALCSLTRKDTPDPEVLQAPPARAAPTGPGGCICAPSPQPLPQGAHGRSHPPPGTLPLAAPRWSSRSPASACRALGRSGVLSEFSSSSFTAGPRSRGLMTSGEPMR